MSKFKQLLRIKEFTELSKRYMGYGQTISKAKFWLKYPRALCRYFYFTILG